jgi:uncharacterized protein
MAQHKHLAVMALLALLVGVSPAAEAATAEPVYRILIAKGKYRDAVRMLTKAARKGDAKAQYQLAVMLRSGLGTARDDKAARTWLKASAKSGHKPASQLLAKLSKIVSTGALPIEPKVSQRRADVAMVDGKGPQALTSLTFTLARSFKDITLDGGGTLLTKPLDESGMTPLMVAARAGQLPAVSAVLVKGADVNQTGRDGRTALHWAATAGHFDIVQLLLEHGANAGLHDNDGNLAADIAAQNCNVVMFKVLATSAAAPDIARQAFDFTTRCKDVEWMQAFPAAVDASTSNASGQTLLEAAIATRNEPLTRALLKSLGKIDATTTSGTMPLHVAAAAGDADIIAMLLLKGADGSALDKDGNTPLMLAAAAGKEEAIRLLLPVSPDVNLKNNDGKTALYLATEGLHTKAVATLVRAGASPQSRSLARDTPEKIAARAGNAKLVAALQGKP